MSARLLCCALLMCAAFTAHAQLTVYEFEGHIATKRDYVTESFNLPTEQYFVGQSFTGEVMIDPGRVRWDSELQEYVDDPLVELTLTTQGGSTFTLSGGDSGIGIRRENGGEQVTMGLTGRLFTSAGGSYYGSASLAWESLTQGQTPDQESELDPAALRPALWNLSLTTMDLDCAPECQSAGRIRAQVTAMWRQGERPTTYSTSFDTAPDWITSGGNWEVDWQAGAGGTYRNVANTAFTSSVNTRVSLGPSYNIYSALYTQWSGTGNTLGLLFNYQDPRNFDEVRFNASGTATLNRIRNGNRSTLGTAQYPGAARTWFGVRVNRDGNRIRVWVERTPIFDVDGGAPAGAHAGVFASWNQARFDNFRIVQSTQWGWVTHPFVINPTGWSQTGEWMATNGYFLSSSSHLAAAIATSPIELGSDYAIDSSMYLEWSAKGNRGGLVYDYQSASNYRAVLFNSGTRVLNGETYDGTFEVIEVRNGVRRVVSPPEPIGTTQILSREWHGVGVRRMGDITTITHYGRVITLRQAEVSGPKRVGLIASYNRVRFDDVLIATHAN